MNTERPGSRSAGSDMTVVFLLLLAFVATLSSGCVPSVPLPGPGDGGSVFVHPVTGEVKHCESSSAGESHPHALTDPDVNLSAHPAPIVQPQAVPPSANAQRGAAAVGQSARANGSLGADGLSASCISAWPI